MTIILDMLSSAVGHCRQPIRGGIKLRVVVLSVPAKHQSSIQSFEL